MASRLDPILESISEELYSSNPKNLNSTLLNASTSKLKNLNDLPILTVLPKDDNYRRIGSNVYQYKNVPAPGMKTQFIYNPPKKGAKNLKESEFLRLYIIYFYNFNVIISKDFVQNLKKNILIIGW